jgi:hypothetical protein
MLERLRALFASGSAPTVDSDTPPPPLASLIEAPGVPAFDVHAHLIHEHALPTLYWTAAQLWVDSIDGGSSQAAVWTACERAWLEHLRASLGPRYKLVEQADVVLLSTLDSRVAAATLAFVNRTLQRIVGMLEGLAQVPAWGKDIVIVFDDTETYYRYVARYYPQDGEFAASGGMYVNAGCGHFVTVKEDLRAIEPIIAHELTHCCLGHLPIPAWLNEGIAVNTERRLCPPALDTFGARPSPQQMHARLRHFWTPATIQEFWCGPSFLRPDEGNELSYELARLLVEHFSEDWGRFCAFANAASRDDGGALAARTHLEIELGRAVAAMLQHEPGAGWEPDPAEWVGEPERGSF